MVIAASCAMDQLCQRLEGRRHRPLLLELRHSYTCYPRHFASVGSDGCLCLCPLLLPRIAFLIWHISGWNDVSKLPRDRATVLFAARFVPVRHEVGTDNRVRRIFPFLHDICDERVLPDAPGRASRSGDDGWLQSRKDVLARDAAVGKTGLVGGWHI